MTASHIPWAPKPLSQNSDLRLFADVRPNAGGKYDLQLLNPNSLKVVAPFVEPSLAEAQLDHKFRFERYWHFVADRLDHLAVSNSAFNRVTGLKDSWGN